MSDVDDSTDSDLPDAAVVAPALSPVTEGVELEKAEAVSVPSSGPAKFNLWRKPAMSTKWVVEGSGDDEAALSASIAGLKEARLAKDAQSRGDVYRVCGSDVDAQGVASA
jgi:hypothetical protein